MIDVSILVPIIIVIVAPPQRRTHRTVEEKLKIIQKYRGGQSLISLENEFGVQRKQIKDWAKHEAELVAVSKQTKRD